MKKRYTFLPTNWHSLGLTVAFLASISLNISAQTAPPKMWDKTFGGNSYDNLQCLQQTFDGGYILGGTSESGISGDKTNPSKGSSDYWIIKIDASGNKIWDKSFGGSNTEQFFSIQQTSDGGYILGGISSSGISGDKSQASQGGTDYWIVKLDGNGNKIWDKTFGGDSNDFLFSIKQTTDGGYILGGESNSSQSGDKTQPSKGGSDYWVIKLDAMGNKLWDKAFGGYDMDYLRSLQQTSDGGFILGGNSSSVISGDKSQNPQGAMDYWIVKLDGNGNKIWDKTFGGSSWNYFSSIEQTPDGGYILGGYSSSGLSGDKSQPSRGLYDCWIVKLDSNGNKLWDKAFGGSLRDQLSSLQTTSDGGFILGGTSESGISGDKSEVNKGQNDYWLVKLDSNGNKLWDKTLGGNNDDSGFSLQQTSDGGYIFGGYSKSGISGDKTQASQGQTDFWIVKVGGNPVGINESEVNFAVSISPNPNQGKFTLQLSNLTAPKAEVTVSDLLGRVVLQQPLNVSNNQLSEELTLPNAKGLYLLQIKVGEQLITRKIVVE